MPPGPDPEDDEDDDDDDDVDINAFEELKGLIPDRDAREAFAEMAQLAKGYRATSESARSSASRMESLMFHMGQEHLNMVKSQEERPKDKLPAVSRVLLLMMTGRSEADQVQLIQKIETSILEGL